MTLPMFENEWAWIWCVAALLLALAEIGRRKVWKWFFIWRVIWILILTFFILDWTLVQSEKWSEPEPFHVYLDGSASILQIPERKEKLKEVIKEWKDWALRTKNPLHFYWFGDGVAKVDDWQNIEIPNKVKWRSELPEISNKGSGIGRAVLFSDGNWTGRWKGKIPTYTVSLGESDEKDIWMDMASTVVTAFLKNRTKIQAEIHQHGYEGESVEVKLLSGRDVVDSQVVRLKTSKTEIEFSLFPEKMGEKVYQIEVKAQKNELTTENNRTSFRLRTVRDKMRILHVNGKPDSDLKAWRSFLTRQPDVDLVSFYILRSLSDQPQASNDELSLIPFPYEDLFTTELDRFDVVILQNFDFNLYFQPFYLSNLVSFIENGGALLFIGGDQGLHQYVSSPLASVIPVDLGGGAPFEISAQTLKTSSTHPMVRGLEASLNRFQLEGFHKVKSLSVAEDLIRTNQGLPFLSIRSYGKGRVVLVNTDESWKFQSEPKEDGWIFGKWARRILQYLTFDPEMESERILSSAWKVGESVTLEHSQKKKIQWEIKPLLTEGGLKRFDQVTKVSYFVESPGLYEVTPSLPLSPIVFETENLPYRGEMKEVLEHEEAMQTIAQQSQAKFYRFDDWKEIFKEALSGQQMLASKTKPWSHRSQFQSWLILLLGILALGLDFYYRKKALWD